MFEGDTSLYVVYAGAALFGIILAEAAYLLVAQKTDRREAVNRRMKIAKKDEITQRDVLMQLRKERGLDGGRFSVMSFKWLQVLRIQSGMTMALPKFLAITTFIALAISVGIAFKIQSNINGVLSFAALLVMLPLFLLKRKRKKRHKIFGVQLPEAIDLMTRGLRAGHPVPVALMMVGREMPDPIGTEFGLVADEITYGSDMISALTNMWERVGQEDLPLFLTAVSIQTSTGGNLREILDGLSKVIRERGKLRRKIRAISSEGRMSAYILTAVPCLLMGVLLVFMPDYYGSATDLDMTWYLLGFAAFWLGLGNLIMFKMATFKF
jgi:tight adherence protein B